MDNDRKDKIRAMRLYGILTEKFCRAPWLETARELAGEVDVLQLREKEMNGRELLLRARALREMTLETGTLLIINDRPDIALLSEADGVHLGQEDVCADDVRELWGDKLLVGLSTHSLGQAVEAAKMGVDYIGIGPVFPTATKGVKTGLGLELVTKICRSVSLPSVAIGGIAEHNAAKALKAGAQSVAAISALCGAESPGLAASGLRKACGRAVGP